MDVFGKYNFTVNSTMKGRGVVIANTNINDEPVILKEYKGSGKHLQWIAGLLDAVNESGKLLVDSYLLNNEGNYITESVDGGRYVVKRWYYCRDCDVKLYADVMNAVGALAQWHNFADGVTGMERLYAARPLEEKFSRRNSELRRIRKYLKTKRQKNYFELLAVGVCDRFLQEGKSAMERFLSFNGKEMNSLQGLCHGDYNYHNICFEKKRPVIINFERMQYGYYMSDLYHFMRKVLEKYDWDIKLGYAMLTEYDAVRPLNEESLRLLQAMFAYPEKFWKIMNGYFNSNKAWLPAKNYEKLRYVINQNEKRLAFIATIH